VNNSILKLEEKYKVDGEVNSKIRSITSEREDFDIDIQIVYKFFFPIYNFTVVLQKVNMA
jgi:hypothetical protein